MASFKPLQTLVKSFAIALMACALTFFSLTFLGIVGIGVYAIITHEKVNFAAGYRYVSAPTALLAFVVAFITNIVLDIRRAMLSDPSNK